MCTSRLVYDFYWFYSSCLVIKFEAESLRACSTHKMCDFNYLCLRTFSDFVSVRMYPLLKLKTFSAVYVVLC